MRCISIMGLLLIAQFIFTKNSDAQPKAGPDTKDPKAPELKVDKDSENKWPTEIAGKKLENWVKDFQNQTDASTREIALKTVPFFGPDSLKVLRPMLLHALMKDPDLSVKLTAIGMVPNIGFAPEDLNVGLDYMISLLKPGSTSSALTKYTVIVALGNCGPNAKRAIPTLVEVSLADKTYWQNRQAAAVALGQLGKNYPPPKAPEPKENKAPESGKPPVSPKAGKEPKESKEPKDAKDPKEAPKEPIIELAPDSTAIRGLIKGLHDPAHMVRRACLSSLLVLGPPDPDDKVYTELRTALKPRFKDADKSVAIWSHVMYMQSETKIISLEDPNLQSLDKFLDDKDSGIRIEAIQGLGLMGDAARHRAGKLLTIVTATDEEPSVIIAAIYALSNMKSQAEKSLPVLERLRNHQDDKVIDTAIGAIALLKGTKRDETNNSIVVGPLLNIATGKDEKSEAIVEAVNALSGIKSQSSRILPVLEKLKKHKNAQVRAAAEEAIAILSAKKSELRN